MLGETEVGKINSANARECFGSRNLFDAAWSEVRTSRQRRNFRLFQHRGLIAYPLEENAGSK